MRRFIPLVVVLFLSIPMWAQLEVKKGSFKEVPGFVNINPDQNYQNDDNDLPFAVIKVRTENITDKQRRDLRFESNLAVGIMLEYKTGEVWVYLTAKYAYYLKISHPDFSSIEFTIPFDLQPKKGYEMTLVNKTGMVPVVDVYNYLVITADQPNSAVYIDDVFAGEQFAQKSFMAGEKHTWRIECELYHTESGEATIPEKEGQNITIEKTLKPAFGYLNVTSSPESGAIVYIDGKKAGQTPYKTDKLASGEHKVRVMKEMFSPAEQTFTITDGNTTQAAMTMLANFVNVTVTTDSESDIYIDNEFKGKGTWSGRLSDGNHAFDARKASHRNSVENIKLTLGKDENIVIPNPTPIYGTLDVSTNPIGANIIIDGKSFGTTPRVLTNVLIGTHELRLEKTGCSPVVKNITLDDKNKLTINEKLATGREISISTDGTGDKIYVDGNYIGTSPLTSTLSFGNHEVKAVRDSKESKKTITVAQSGGDTSVKLTFRLENKTFTVNGVTFEMIAVKGGTFTMGCTLEQGGDCDDDEKPSHSVTLGDYYIGKFEVTQELWYAVMGTTVSQQRDQADKSWSLRGEGNNYPMYYISWNECQEFVRKLNQKTGANFRLPTEAEWEYAARGGNKSNGYKYSGSNSIDNVAWYDGNSGSKTHPVGAKTPNELGIYDMSGNVWEWCQDWYGNYSSSSQTNQQGPSSGSDRVLRGGCWSDYARGCRVSNRRASIPDFRYYYYGFRLVLVP
ncbi:MAG: SUMF1/EgtB/PvdO family nonheme iron enzyme [Bacteroidales bacterium]|nr:SUMF1/EgtB/PvdO family nonheme iron enzyme [Bacteroidales bacterium]